jgi:hypothetical protein
VYLGAEGGWLVGVGVFGGVFGGGFGGVVGARRAMYVVVEFLSAAPHPNLKEQKRIVRENEPRTSYNGRTELIRGIYHDRIMMA